MTQVDGRITALIVDDEPLARESVRILLDGDPEVEVVGECGGGAEAVDAIQTLGPDLLFLDVQMPEVDGFEVLRRLEMDRLPTVVFVTAYDRYALRAFDVHALDYLLKPFDDERFHTALERAKAHVRREKVDELSRRIAALVGEDAAPPRPAPPRERTPAARGYLTRIAVKGDDRVSFLAVDRIDWIEAADYYVRIHVGAECHLLRDSLRSLEEKLDPERFFRIHRSAIVNLERVKELRPWFKGRYQVVLHDGTELTLSRRRRKRLEALLGTSL